MDDEIFLYKKFNIYFDEKLKSPYFLASTVFYQTTKKLVTFKTHNHSFPIQKLFASIDP